MTTTRGIIQSVLIGLLGAAIVLTLATAGVIIAATVTAGAAPRPAPTCVSTAPSVPKHQPGQAGHTPWLARSICRNGSGPVITPESTCVQQASYDGVFVPDPYVPWATIACTSTSEVHKSRTLQVVDFTCSVTPEDAYRTVDTYLDPTGATQQAISPPVAGECQKLT
jgi:hypothetical protein